MKINPNLLVGSIGKLLWLNENVTQAWASEKTITMNTSDYDFYQVVYFTSMGNSDSSVMTTGLIPKGKTTQIDFLYNGNNNQVVIRRREFTYVSDTQYKVGVNTGNDGDYTCRPYCVIGFKLGVL